ncbi:MAG: hypothetical protein DIU70_011300 [Bacillota bacterium]
MPAPLFPEPWALKPPWHPEPAPEWAGAPGAFLPPAWAPHQAGISIPVPIGGYSRQMPTGVYPPPGPFHRDLGYPYRPQRITLTPVILHILVEAILVEVEEDPEPAPPRAGAAALFHDPARAPDRDPPAALEFSGEFPDPAPDPAAETDA